MGLSGFLYLAIVVGWAVYLVPFALKRYDEATRNRSIDRFSSAMRVLGREEAEDAPSGHPDANPGAPPETAPASPVPPGPAREAQRAASRVAARRRRRVLLTLLLATAGTATAAALAYLPSWSAVVTGTLLVLWLVVCRSQARREYAARAPYRTERSARPPVREEIGRFDAAEAVQVEPEERHADVAPAADVADSVDAADVVDVAPNEMPADDEPTVVIAREDMPDGEEREFAGSGSLWDPVPVTLPTYVHKPRAPRTIRTIDLGTEEARSPRRSEESAIYTHRTHTVEPGNEQQESGETPQARQESGPTRRAVGE